MNVLMIGVDKTSIGGMRTVVENYMNNDEFREKINFRYIPSVINSNVIVKILFFLMAYIRILFTILFCKIDILHIHMAERTSVYREGLISVLGKALGRKVVIHMHGADIENWYNSLSERKKKISSSLIGSADKVIVLGDSWRPFMEKVVNDKNKVVVVYNAVSTYSRNNYNINATDLLFLGMIIPRKGIIDLLDAIMSIDCRLPKDVKVKLYGSDKNHNIINLIDSRNLQNRVEFCGWLNTKDKAKVFNDTMINILPSYNEGLPMTILETMAFGIPNISTAIAAIPEVIEDGKNGYLMSPGDRDTLGKRIIELVENPILREEFSENSYKTITENFSVDKHLDDIYNLYNELIYGQRQ